MLAILVALILAASFSVHRGAEDDALPLEGEERDGRVVRQYPSYYACERLWPKLWFG